MILEFQVLYREQRSLTMAEASASGAKLANGDAVAPVGPIHSLIIRARDEKEVRDTLNDFKILSISKPRVVIAPEQSVFTLEEAAAFTQYSADQIGRFMGKGKLPKAREGHPRFTRRMLEQLIEEEVMEKKAA